MKKQLDSLTQKSAGAIPAREPSSALFGGRLGQLGKMSMFRGTAKTAFISSYTLWKDADPDIPALSQARTEYAKLQ